MGQTVEILGQLLDQPARVLDEERRQTIQASLEQHMVPLDGLNQMPTAGIDERQIGELAGLFMNDHPEIFNHPRSDVRMIYAVDEVRTWLQGRPDLQPTDVLEQKVLCYSIFKAVQMACRSAWSAEAYFKYK